MHVGSPRGAERRRGTPATGGEPSYPDFVEERISHLAEERAARGAASRRSPTSSWRWPPACAARAWPEIAGLAVAGLLFVASLVV